MYQGADRGIGNYIGGGELWSDDAYLHSRRRSCGRYVFLSAVAIIIVIGVIVWAGLVG